MVLRSARLGVMLVKRSVLLILYWSNDLGLTILRARSKLLILKDEHPAIKSDQTATGPTPKADYNHRKSDSLHPKSRHIEAICKQAKPGLHSINSETLFRLCYIKQLRSGDSVMKIEGRKRRERPWAYIQ
ncbi:hypothetical protein J2Z64_003519 [Oceanobacillus polygoni]|uniref:Uncharacterized protein n=1 Tax=Oceanobacillus polygoni TaxID=1235259 RepID=A0A9X0YVK9_9BACI|nr:hypothetical protein [Oceanobacillus polygoni]